tara:strand:- start:3559 stop:5763 length:2205 start_codon:yes stop_codon:yes gene_type:complete
VVLLTNAVNKKAQKERTYRISGILCSIFILLKLTSIGLAEKREAVEFENDLIPIFTKMGCNAGKCHGSAIGRGDFKLSLYGGDPESDFEEIVRRMNGRRVNLSKPDESLIVLKPTANLKHGGRMVFDDDSESERLLIDWIKQGAKNLKHRHLKHVEVTPRKFVATKTGATAQLKVTAHYDNGKTRDVTAWTTFVAEDSSAVDIDADAASAEVRRGGRHIVVARYLSEVIPIVLVSPLNNQAVDLSSEPRNNFVDEYVLRLLAELRLPTSPLADDGTFLRRVTLDLTGRLPEYNHESRVPGFDREAIVDKLLSSEEFVDFYTLKLAKLLRIQSKNDKNRVTMTTKAARGFHNWIAEQLRNGVGYDQIANEIITATGDTTKVGPATFYIAVEDPQLQTEFATEVFMGSRMKCANCHNHPLDKWTQDDFHGLTAIFAKLTRQQVVKINPLGSAIHPNTGEAAQMKIPGEEFLPAATTDGREAFANWLTARDNPYFAKATVNRLWKSLMGRGLVEPVDDFRSTNPATHPVLLNKLAEDFIEHGYDLRHTLKLIAMSATYARSSITVDGNETDDRFYSHMIQKPMEPAVLADAISDVLGVASQYGSEQYGTRAVELPDGSIRSDALDILGRCDRSKSCEGAPSPTGPLAQRLHLFNGGLLNDRVGAVGSRLDQFIKAEMRPMEIVEDYYQTALNRPPNEQEVRFLSMLLNPAKSSKEQRNLLGDFVWSIATCKEFVTNH